MLVRWEGNKTSMEGRFVHKDGTELGIGAYCNGKYEVLLSDGNMLESRSAAQALAKITHYIKEESNGRR